jgi:hypothetical protein
MKEDWQRGDDSKMTSIERLMHHMEWLQQQHKEVKDKILQRKKQEEGDEPPVQGFPKD